MKKKTTLSWIGGGLIAVVLVAVVAPAFGGPSAFSSLSNKKTKQLIRKEVKKQVKKVKRGPAGAPGAAGADGTARAGARVVGSDASLSPGTAFGGIEATKSATGGYCIRVPFTPRNIVASVESDDHNARVRLFAFGGGFGTCASSLPGYQAWVTTHLLVGNAFSDSDFFVLVN